MDADEARERGLGAMRGCMVAVVILLALVFIIWSAIRAAH